MHTLEIPEYKTLQMHGLHMYIVHRTYTCRFIKKIEIFATKDEQPAGEMGWAFAYCGGARTQYPTKTQRIQSSHVNISKVKNKKYSCTEDEQ